MLNYWKRLFHQIFYIGVGEQTPKEILEKVVFSNMVFAVAIVATSSAIPINIQHGHMVMNVTDVIHILTCFLCLWLNSKHHYLAARVLFLIGFGLTIVVWSAATGPWIPHESYLLVFSVLTSLMFHSSERRLSLAITLGFLACYLFLVNQAGPILNLDGSTYSLSDRYTVETLFLIAFVLSIRALAVANDKANLALKAANTKIRASQMLIESMLNSINEAFLIFDKNGICKEQPSQTSVRLLGFDPTNKHISEVLETDPLKRKNVESWFAILAMDRFDFQSTSSRGISRIETNGGKTSLKVSYHQLLNDRQELQSVIVTAIDISREVATQKLINEERERANMILRIFENKSAFRSLLSQCDKVFSSLCGGIGDDLDSIKRELHTLKGTAMIFGMSSIAEEIYQMELALPKMKDEVHKNETRTAAGVLYKKFVHWRVQNLQLFTKIGVYEDGTVEVSLRKLLQLKTAASADHSPELARAFEHVLGVIMNTEFSDILKDFETHVANIAAKLSKKVNYRVLAAGDAIFIEPGVYRETIRSLVHIINNAIDHGIEIPSERLRKGKPESGTITVLYEKVSLRGKPWLKIQIDDDGAGIDIAKLSKGLSAGDASHESGMSDLDIAMRIFESGVTTREDVTDMSGQGVGLSAVKAAIQKMRGKIRISKTDSLGTSFEILLPDLAKKHGDSVVPVRLPQAS